MRSWKPEKNPPKTIKREKNQKTTKQNQTQFKKTNKNLHNKTQKHRN